MVEDRARSFMERYVIARAVHFRTGEDEAEDLWDATLMAKNAYRMIANVANTAEPAPDYANVAMQSQSSGQLVGVKIMARPPMPAVGALAEPKRKWWGGNNDQSRKPKRSA